MDWIQGNPKKRGEYLAFQPASTAMGVEITERRQVIYWTGTRWHSSFPVTHYAVLPPNPKDGDSNVTR